MVRARRSPSSRRAAVSSSLRSGRSVPFTYISQCPRMPVSQLSGDEADNADHLEFLLSMLGGYARTLEDAVHLFDYFERLFGEWREKGDGRETIFRGWPAVAARDAALSIYHFGIVLSGIRSRIGVCPTLFPLCNHNDLKSAWKMFRDSFPTAERMRHAIGHSSDMVVTPGKLLKNIPKTGEFANMLVLSSLVNKRLTFTFNGEGLSVEISNETAERIEAIKRVVWEAFGPIEEAYGTKPSLIRPTIRVQTGRRSLRVPKDRKGQ